MVLYLVGALFFLLAWCVLFALAAKSRRAMLWSSLACGHAGPVSEYWHLKDYWGPDYLSEFRIGDWVFGVEDYLFAFAYAGISAGIFDLLIRRSGERDLTEFSWPGFAKLVLCGACVLGGMAALAALAINSVPAIVIAFLVGAMFILARHPPWVPAAMGAGAIAAGLTFLAYWGFYFRLFPGLLEGWWRPEALSGVLLAGVPLEEVVWAGAAAVFVGPAVRHCMGRRRLPSGSRRPFTPRVGRG